MRHVIAVALAALICGCEFLAHAQAQLAAAPSAQTQMPHPEPNPPEDRVTRDTPRAPLKALGVATAGVGLAGLVLGSVFGLEALNRKHSAGCDASSVCPNPVALASLNKAQTYGNLSTTVFGIGGVLVASGIALWLIAPSGGVQVTPSASSNAAGLLVRGWW